jgi:hypothetical protein
MMPTREDWKYASSYLFDKDGKSAALKYAHFSIHRLLFGFKNYIIHFMDTGTLYGKRGGCRFFKTRESAYRAAMKEISREK